MSTSPSRACGRASAGLTPAVTLSPPFGPDNPGVAFAPVSRFGVLELTVPRRARPALDILTDEDGEVSALTWALAMVRAIEREAAADALLDAELEAEHALVDALGALHRQSGVTRIDLTGLDIGDTIRAADIKLPAGAELELHVRDATVASIATSSAMQSEEAETTTETTEGEEPEAAS